MANPFPRESGLVDLLMRRLGIKVIEPYVNPNSAAGQETGLDVVAMTADWRVGVQVTEVDTGAIPGRVRATEKVVAREALQAGKFTYGSWAQNDPEAMLAAVVHAMNGKVKKSFSRSRVDEVWLLISCGIPEVGSVASTFIMTSLLDVGALSRATLEMLSKSGYDKAFLHSVLGTERALYRWTPQGGWGKTIQETYGGSYGPSALDVIADKSWLNNSNARSQLEIDRFLTEIRRKIG